MLFNSRDWITIARSFDFRVKYRIKKQYKSSETACVCVCVCVCARAILTKSHIKVKITKFYLIQEIGLSLFLWYLTVYKGSVS